MRIVVADDSVLFREGLVRLLTEVGHTVVAAVGDADQLPAAVAESAPDLVVIDVRMPPTMTDDGAKAAGELRRAHPGLPMLLLSQHVETRHSVALVAEGGFGYLLKDRVLRVDDFLDALTRVAAGGSALDPQVVGALLAPARRDTALSRLTDRERDVLALVAEGHSNAGVATRLHLGERTVETHMRAILQKLDIPETADHHRRVLAAVTYLLLARPAG
ncbi:response regulator [Yinghuangia seranimata]|uniref:response regulator n=1 Tax=Yinghuangia seranimata TaxID=408067 RepID=UPI00248CADD3|nr:response regulator transcription factor [Yinghuangia seranimata]MDI2125484.1 response regulator transcription factor [Yinghuangia seranimata]